MGSGEGRVSVKELSVNREGGLLNRAWKPSRVKSTRDARCFAARYGFWKVLLAESHTRSELHTNISPGRASYVGARRHGHEWNYVVLMEETRVELYINSSNPADNKPMFDALYAERDEIEAAFGDNLHWQRLDDKKVSRSSFTVPGGWADEDGITVIV